MAKSCPVKARHHSGEKLGI